MVTDFPRPGALVETSWLEANLGNPGLVILDCALDYLTGSPRNRDDWLRGHIPGSVFADLEELSDDASDLPLMAPRPEHFAGMMAALGLGRDSLVVLYDNAWNMCAARIWWMLRAHGFTRAVVLNGGWRKWCLEKRPVSRTASDPVQAAFPLKPGPACFVGKDAVARNLATRRACVIDALAPEVFRGDVKRYARPGHIPGSINIPAVSLVNRETGAYLPAKELAEMFGRGGLGGRRRVITYCGGGVAACSVAFALFLLGYDEVRVYDGSLIEWAADRSLPMELGDGRAGVFRKAAP